MDDESRTKEFLQKRIEQLEHERDALRKDIEQLCMQQAGPSYLAIATRMYFQRTTGLEEEIEMLKNKLAGLLREQQNLQEELSEAYRIKTQLANLHNAELLKNIAVEEQLKFFQGCIATAFSERDRFLLESEKAKDREESILEKLNISQRRVEELESAYYSEKERHDASLNELSELKEQIEYFEKVIDKFYAIRERDAGPFANHTWQSRCSCLLDDSSDKWVFNCDSRSTTSNYIVSLEEEIDSRKHKMEKLQNNLHMGIQIEQRLKRSVRFFEKKQMKLLEMFDNWLSSLRHICNQHRTDVLKILEEEKSHWDEVLLQVEKKILLANLKSDSEHESFQETSEHQSFDSECKDVHVTDDVDSSVSMKGEDFHYSRMDNTSDAFSQALQEKVAALLLLSQQEERHLLERETNAALQQKMEELRRNLSQVTSEKIGALMELAQLKREYELLQDRHVMKCAHLSAASFEKSITLRQCESEGKLAKIMKRTSLLHWAGKNYGPHDTNVKVSNESNVIVNENYSMDFARLKVDYVALQESLSNLEHLTSSVHRLHVSLLKEGADAGDFGSSECVEPLDEIIAEANQVKTALCSSLPVSWSSDPTVNTFTYESLFEPVDSSTEQRSNRVFCAAGFEMIELFILATKLFKEKTSQNAKNNP